MGGWRGRGEAHTIHWGGGWWCIAGPLSLLYSHKTFIAKSYKTHTGQSGEAGFIKHFPSSVETQNTHSFKLVHWFVPSFYFKILISPCVQIQEGYLSIFIMNAI